MSRKKTEIDPVRAERLKKIIDREGISQIDFAKRISQTQQNVSRIINLKSALTEETARTIVSVFPEYRIEWLLGYDNSMTVYDQLSDAIQTAEEESALLHNGFISFAKLSGFKIDFSPIEEAETLEETFHNMNNYCTVSRDGKSVTFSLSELNAFENELSDYIEFRLLREMK